MSVGDVVGVLGAVAVLAGYLLLQLGRLTRNDWSFLLLNLFGAAGILCSLAFKFNLSAALIEAFWFAISLYGLARLAFKRRRAS